MAKEPAPAAAPDPAPSGDIAAGAPENHYAPSPAPAGEGDDFSFVPEKFLKDGKPDWQAFSESYSNLEQQWNTKNEELLEKAKSELFQNRPEAADKYEAPEIEGWDKEEMQAHPLMEWWREEAFNRGLSNEEFQESVKRYAESQAAGYDYNKEIEKLGDNAKARVQAVGKWMEKYKDNDKIYRQLDILAGTADGIETLETLMGGGQMGDSPDEDVPAVPEISLQKLQEMQADPRYYSSTHRDPEFVRKVDEGFRKLYG